jgi:hypothetical protein
MQFDGKISYDIEKSAIDSLANFPAAQAMKDLSAYNYAKSISQCAEFDDMEIIQNSEFWKNVTGYENIKTPIQALDTYIDWFEKNKADDDTEF